MAYALKNRLFLSLLFNGKEFPFEANALDFVHLSSSVRAALPILTFKITDVTKFLTRNNFLVDGTLITVTAGKEQQKTAYNFRLFSFTEIPSNSPQYKVHAYLDLPLYWSSSLSEPQKGTSNEVLKALASRCGFQAYSGTNTSDSQVWLPQNLPIREFVRRIQQHGWANDSSCMKSGVTLAKEFRYRNVSDFAAFPVKDFFATGKVSGQTKPMVDYTIENRAGFFNVSTGYGEERIVQSVIDADESYRSVQLQKNSSKLMMNSELKGTVERNKVGYTPIDVGNTHPNYERAGYQNRRLGNLFTLHFDLLTGEFSEADLLDVVNIEVELPDVKGSRQYSGKYLVMSKVLYIKGGNYYEKLELARHGINEAREKTQS